MYNLERGIFMANETSVRYSNLVLAKLRDSLVIKDGLVCNNDYEGSPTAGAVKVPVRDEEVKVSDYDKANGIQGSTSSTHYETILIDKDKAVNEIIDGYEAAAVPDGIVAERLDSAGYSLARQLDIDASAALIAGSSAYSEQILEGVTKTNVYDIIVGLRTQLNAEGVPDDGMRFLLVTPEAEAAILKSDEFISASDLGDSVKMSGSIGMIAGFNVMARWSPKVQGMRMLAGHPRFFTRVREFTTPVSLVDLSGSGKFIGSSAVQGRMAYAHKVLRSKALVFAGDMHAYPDASVVKLNISVDGINITDFNSEMYNMYYVAADLDYSARLWTSYGWKCTEDIARGAGITSKVTGNSATIAASGVKSYFTYIITDKSDRVICYNGVKVK